MKAAINRDTLKNFQSKWKKNKALVLLHDFKSKKQKYLVT